MKVLDLKELIAALQALDLEGQDGAPVVFEGREGEYMIGEVSTYRGGEDGELVVACIRFSSGPSLSMF